MLVGFIVISGLFSLGGGLGLLGLATFLIERGLDIKQIPVLAAVEGGALILDGIFTLLTGRGLHRRRRWAWYAAALLCSFTLTGAAAQLAFELTLYHALSFILNLFLLGLLFWPGVRPNRLEKGTPQPSASNGA